MDFKYFTVFFLYFEIFFKDIFCMMMSSSPQEILILSPTNF